MSNRPPELPGFNNATTSSSLLSYRCSLSKINGRPSFNGENKPNREQFGCKLMEKTWYFAFSVGEFLCPPAILLKKVGGYTNAWTNWFTFLIALYFTFKSSPRTPQMVQYQQRKQLLKFSSEAATNELHGYMSELPNTLPKLEGSTLRGLLWGKHWRSFQSNLLGIRESSHRETVGYSSLFYVPSSPSNASTMSSAL